MIMVASHQGKMAEHHLQPREGKLDEQPDLILADSWGS